MILVSFEVLTSIFGEPGKIMKSIPQSDISYLNTKSPIYNA
jgi:hypothetical protein